MMGDNPESSLMQYASVLRDRWLLVLLTTIVGGLVAAGYLLLAPTTYTATAAVQINVISSDPFQSSQSASDLIDGSTEASIATSYAVASLAAEQLETPRTPNEIRQAVVAEPVADATVLEISYTGGSPDSAREGADVIAGTYLDFRESQARARLASMIEMIDDQLTGLRQELVQANAMAAVADANSSDANQAASDRELVTIEINSLINRKNVLESINTVGGVVLTPARDNPVDTAPSKRTVAASGVLGGFLLGLMLAFVAKGLDRRVRSTSEIARLTGSPVLAELTELHARVPADGTDLTSLRLVRERLLASLPDGARTVLILDQTTGSAVPADLAANLALVFGQSDQPVELVLPAAPEETSERMAAGMQLELPVGFSSGRASAIVPSLTVYLTPVGTAITEPDPTMTSAVRSRLTGQRSDALQFLSLTGEVGAPARLAAYRYSDGAVLVITKGGTHAERATAMASEMRDAHVPLLGVIVVPRGRTSEQLENINLSSVPSETSR